MADRILLIAWDEPKQGLEARAIEVFNDALGLLGRLQQEGHIESFDVSLLAPNSNLAGFIVIRGSQEQISALRDDEEFQRNTTDSQLTVEGIRHIEGVTNEGVATQMQMYMDAISKVPQRT